MELTRESVYNGMKLTGVDPKQGKLYVDALGNPDVKTTPQSLLPNKLYTEKYFRFSNSLPFSCPDKWVKKMDDVPSSGGGNLIFGKSVATGLPICQSTDGSGKMCYPHEISLMGENMFSDRGITKCGEGGSGSNEIRLIGDKSKFPSKCDSIEAAQKICDADEICQGFVVSNDNGTSRCHYIRGGLGGNGEFLRNLQNMSNVKLVGGTKYTTYIKNRAGSDYSAMPWGSLSNVSMADLGLGKEGFIGSGGNMVRNSVLLVVVLILVGLVLANK